MARSKTREISITESQGMFSIFKSPKTSKENYDFESMKSLRQLLSNEKARILNIIKNNKPSSIYNLAKILGRSFKSVFDDIKLLERFGFVELIKEKTKKRARLRPVIVADNITINIKI